MAEGLGSRETVGQATDTSSVSSGVVTVQFRDRTDIGVKVEDLNPVQGSKLLAKYKLEECFGELALLCNTRRIGTAHATEDGQRSGGRVAQRVHCVHCAVFVLTNTALACPHITFTVLFVGLVALCAVFHCVKGREGKGREGKGREGKGREGKGREGNEG